MTTRESKGRFFLQNESIRTTNRIDSNRELECSTQQKSTEKPPTSSLLSSRHSDTVYWGRQYNTKLNPRKAQTCVLPHFCDRDLEINLMTLKLEGDLDILNIYLHIVNEINNFITQNMNFKNTNISRGT